MIVMLESKNMVVDLTEILFEEVEKTLEYDGKKKTEFIKEAIIHYINEKKRLATIEEMKKGYIEMARLNMEFAELGIQGELTGLIDYEVSLSESEIRDDNGSEKRRYILC